MGMNPETNEFEMLTEPKLSAEQEEQLREKMERAIGEGRAGQLKGELEKATQPVRPNGEPVPAHWPVFKLDEHVVVKGYTFKVAYIGEKTLLLEPVGLPVLLTAPSSCNLNILGFPCRGEERNECDGCDRKTT